MVEDLALDEDTIKSLCTVDTTMGKDLDALFDLIDGQAKM